MSKARARASATFAVASRKTNVRRFIGAFLGRTDVLARIDRALEGGARLVTLLGPPGIGKTRLSHRWLEQRGADYERWGGAWFVDLSSATDRRGVAHAVATAIWPEAPIGAAIEDEIGAALASAGPTAVVLDNFEQVVASSSDLVRRWCQIAPELHVIVTSRERLAVEGETVIELEPLACPPEGATADEILACDAVKLLTLRAEAVGGELGGDPRALGELVRQLDGIPLAIELAAARTRVLPPNELTRRLKQRGGQNLASAIAWSWNLLSSAEQRALAECSVFAGSFGIEAADEVLSSPSMEPGASVEERIAALRDKSLLHPTEGGRLALYVSIRDYAAQKLDELGPEVARAARERHARHYARAATSFNEARTFQGASPDHDLRARLTRDRDNLVLALEREQAGDPAIVTELALALTLLQAAPAEMCLAALGDALARFDLSRADHRTLRSRILLSRQGLWNALGRFDDGRADLELLLAQDDLTPGIRVFGVVEQGIQFRYHGLAHDAWAVHETAAKELAGDGYPLRLRAMNTACMGRLKWDLGDEAGSRELNERARIMCVEIGDPWLEGLPLANIAQLEQELGRFDLAASLLDRALACFRTASEPHYIAVYSIAYGDLHLEEGRLDEARKWYAGAASFFHRWLAHRQNAQLESAWAALEARAGDFAEADEHLASARRSAERGKSDLVRLFVELHAAQVELARVAKDPTALANERATWRARTSALRTGDDRDAALVKTSFDVRFALRMLERVVDGGALPRATVPPPSLTALSVAPNGEWFALGAGARVDLARRASLKRILRALVDRHREAPGLAIGRDALVAKGWPDERLHPEAASTRLRVAIATLRSLGLREVLRTSDDGYLLDRAATVRETAI